MNNLKVNNNYLDFEIIYFTCVSKNYVGHHCITFLFKYFHHYQGTVSHGQIFGVHVILIKHKCTRVSSKSQNTVMFGIHAKIFSEYKQYKSITHSYKIKLSVLPASPALYVAILDSPRMSRMDRNSRSVSQPRGKRDSSVNSAYGGGIL